MQLHLFWLKQVIQKNILLASIKGMFIKVIITQIIMGLLEKFIPLHDPQKPLYQEKFHTSQRARIEWVKDRSIQQSSRCDS